MKPATSLPWEASRRDDKQGNWTDTLIEQAVNYGGLRIARVENPTHQGFVDAVYIVHACNAYPRLVEALRQCCAAIEAAEAYEQERSGELDAMPEPSRDAAELLLRELGELE